MTVRSTSPANRIRTACIAACLTVAELFASSAASAADDEGYSLGVLPYLVPRNMAALYGPAAVDLSRQLGKPVKLRTSRSFERFHDNLRSRIYDVAVIQPFDFGLAVDEAGYLPLVQVDQQLQAVVVVPGDADFQSLADLKGRRVVMAPESAATSRQGRWALADAGLRIGKDVTVEYLSTHDACLHELLVAAAAACVTGPPPLQDFAARTGAKLRVLLRTPPIPHMLAVVDPQLPEADRERLAAIMMGWRDTPSGQSLLKAMRFPGWVPVDVERYTALQARMAEEVAAQQPATLSRQLLFGSFPYLQPRVLATQLAPITQAFSRQIGETVHFRTTPTFERFTVNLAEAQYDIALVRPFSYAAAERAGYKPLARVKDDMVAGFYVREDSAVRQLADLRGKIVATPPASAVLTQVGTRHLVDKGLQPGRDLTLEHRRGHDSCLREVATGEAAACITTSILVNTLAGNISTRFRLLDQSPPVPGVLFMAHERLPAAVRLRLKELILSWNHSGEGEQIHRSSWLGPFAPVDAVQYRRLSNR